MGGEKIKSRNHHFTWGGKTFKSRNQTWRMQQCCLRKSYTFQIIPFFGKQDVSVETVSLILQRCRALMFRQLYYVLRENKMTLGWGHKPGTA